MLNRCAVLVAEDQPFIALDLALAIEDAGGRVIGPASSVKEALALLEIHPVMAAILDVNLIDGDVTPVVAYLIERGVPLILQSGVELPSDLAIQFPDLIVHTKPNIAAKLVSEIKTLLEKRREMPPH